MFINLFFLFAPLSLLPSHNIPVSSLFPTEQTWRHSEYNALNGNVNRCRNEFCCVTRTGVGDNAKLSIPCVEIQCLRLWLVWYVRVGITQHHSVMRTLAVQNVLLLVLMLTAIFCKRMNWNPVVFADKYLLKILVLSAIGMLSKEVVAG